MQELLHGDGQYSFDWEVKCVRKGHEGFEVVRNKSMELIRPETGRDQFQVLPRPLPNQINLDANEIQKPVRHEN